MKKFTTISLLISISLILLNLCGYSQCDYFEDFSSSSGWTQVGSQVEIQNGAVAYLNGSPDNIQRYVYKYLNDPYSSDECWTLTMAFKPTQFGSEGGDPYVGHFLFALTENETHPWYNCSDPPCTGYPSNDQDAIIINLTADNNPTGDVYYRVVKVQGGSWVNSDNIIYNGIDEYIYIELTKNCGWLTLNLYADEAKTIQVGDGPVNLEYEALADLEVIQHGNNVAGIDTRKLWGEIDYVCIDDEEQCGSSYDEITYDGCEGDGYFIEVNGTIYDESNPNGTEIYTDDSGCEITIDVNLNFYPLSYDYINYVGCENDGYWVNVNGTIYDENNPTGTEYLTNSVGCDSIVTIDLSFEPNSYYDISYEGCEGDGYFVIINGNYYDEFNPSGTETLSNSAGCDSIITINLSFYPETFGSIIYSGCENDGYNLVLNGNIYDESNPLGTETILNANGCDSIITIELYFYPETYGSVTYEGCEGDGFFVIVGGNLYNETHPLGQEIISNMYGCDSIVDIELVFFPTSVNEINYEGCEGDDFEIEVNGTLYGEYNTFGTEYLINQYGCDSVMYIDLIFHENTEDTIAYVGCIGDGYQVVVNGTLYYENNPTGEEWLTDQFGCDSIIYIDLVFYEASENYIYYEGCEGDDYEIEVNGTFYGEYNTIGIEYMSNQFACDSVIYIDLVYYENNESYVSYDGCIGDNYEIEVNGTIYGEYNTFGIEYMSNQFACDSVIYIDLVYNESDETFLGFGGCEGDNYEIIVNGNSYNEANPSGTEYMVNQYGCDSTIYIDLTFAETVYSTLSYIGCTGDGYSVEVNETVYDEDNPTGTETLSTTEGCDSIVTIDLLFYEDTENTISYSGCTGDGYEIEVNGNLYNESNPNGTEVLTNENGCELIINVELSFSENTEALISYSGCEDDGYEIEVNNTLYNETNPSGTEVLENSNGCDSIIFIDLSFFPNSFGEYYYEGCEKDLYEIEINGSIYNEDNPSGTEIISNSNGCDSLLEINMIFHPIYTTVIDYNGTKGDGYEITIDDTIYNEENPEGRDTLKTIFGCDSIIIIDLNFDDVTIHQPLSYEMIKLYPNPAKNWVFIDWVESNFKTENFLLTIYSSTGIKVFQQYLSTSENIIILPSEIESGIYFFELNEPKAGYHVTKKVFIQQSY